MIKIIAIEKTTGERTHVEGYMYFFEEQVIRDINDSTEYDFEIYIDDIMVFPHQANGADGQSGSMPQGDVLPEHVAGACCRRTLAAGWGEANWNRITKTNTSPYTTAIVLKYCQRWQMYGLL
jgi:hypothetical protein